MDSCQSKCVSPHLNGHLWNMDNVFLLSDPLSFSFLTAGWLLSLALCSHQSSLLAWSLSWRGGPFPFQDESLAFAPFPLFSFKLIYQSIHLLIYHLLFKETLLAASSQIINKLKSLIWKTKQRAKTFLHLAFSHLLLPIFFWVLSQLSSRESSYHNLLFLTFQSAALGPCFHYFMEINSSKFPKTSFFLKSVEFFFYSSYLTYGNT